MNPYHTEAANEPLAAEKTNFEPGPEESRQAEYELARARVFSAIRPLERSVSELTEAVKEVEDSDEKEYVARLAKLRQREAELASVKRFEERLWGNDPAEHEARSAELFAAMKSMKNPDDALRIMDEWGALPGKNDISKPFTDRAALGNLLKEVGAISRDEALRKAESLFSNQEVAERVAALFEPAMPESHPEHAVPMEEPPYEAAPEVYAGDFDGPDEPLLAQRTPEENGHEVSRPIVDARVFEERIADLRQQISDAEDNDDESMVIALEEALREVEKARGTADMELRGEIRRLGFEEHALIDSRAVIDSAFMKMPRFLQKLMPGGKDKLALLEKAGIDVRAGASRESLALARSLKLKAVREKGHALLGRVSHRFAHDMDARAASERENEVPFVAMNSEMKKERMDQVLDAERPQRIHARNIRRIIENQ